MDLLESGEKVNPQFFSSATEFMRGFADQCHHAKEEGILFSQMKQQGIAMEGCPLGVMLAEHECGRQYTRALTSATQAMQAGDESGSRRAIMSSRSYIALLRLHIYKEDNILFPMADQVIPPGQNALIMNAFEQVEKIETGEGFYEKYEALAEALERDIQSYSHKAQ
ncbi:MAG: cation-binding protein [Anaerolineales bacterium]|nr:cation-binding protein [Anaerolineae bacterium]PWB53545.1 MAG: cation-binding protein [Anaerolineales bacterium]